MSHINPVSKDNQNLAFCLRHNCHIANKQQDISTKYNHLRTEHQCIHLIKSQTVVSRALCLSRRTALNPISTACLRRSKGKSVTRLAEHSRHSLSSSRQLVLIHKGRRMRTMYADSRFSSGDQGVRNLVVDVRATAVHWLEPNILHGHIKLVKADASLSVRVVGWKDERENIEGSFGRVDERLCGFGIVNYLIRRAFFLRIAFRWHSSRLDLGGLLSISTAVTRLLGVFV